MTRPSGSNSDRVILAKPRSVPPYTAPTSYCRALEFANRSRPPLSRVRILKFRPLVHLAASSLPPQHLSAFTAAKSSTKSFDRAAHQTLPRDIYGRRRPLEVIKANIRYVNHKEVFRTRDDLCSMSIISWGSPLPATASGCWAEIPGLDLPFISCLLVPGHVQKVIAGRLTDFPRPSAAILCSQLFPPFQHRPISAGIQRASARLFEPYGLSFDHTKRPSAQRSIRQLTDAPWHPLEVNCMGAIISP